MGNVENNSIFAQYVQVQQRKAITTEKKKLLNWENGIRPSRKGSNALRR